MTIMRKIFFEEIVSIIFGLYWRSQNGIGKFEFYMMIIMKNYRYVLV